jgi:hypothetical protein
MTDLEQRQSQFALTFGLTLNEYKRLASSLRTEDLIAVLELMRAKKHRSRKRALYAEFVRSWLKSPVTVRPLTGLQLKEITPHWPVQFRIPT